MKRILLCFLIAVVSIISASAQRKTDPLDRGLVAVKVNSGVFVSWRVQADEYYGVTYNLYRNGSLIAQNLNASNFSDTGGNTSSTYTVAPVRYGVVGAQCAAATTWAKQYLEIPMANVQANNGVTVWKFSDPSTAMANYTINDVSLGDVDGDGKIDFIVKRKNQTDQDNLFPTNNYTMYCHIECYASSINYGRLWWIDCGPNICYGADEQWDAVAFDWNEDGACEVLYRGGANTVLHHSDGTTNVIGNASENIRGGITHTANMTFSNSGEEWLMYIDGRTGKAYDAIAYPLPRGNANDWGDGYGHRSSKYFMGAPYLDGQNPYIFLGRGIYTKILACTYRVNKSTNKLYKVGNTWNSYNNSGWYGQGNHNFNIADVDLDGADEIIYGSMVLDFHTGDNSLHGMSSTGLGHGDAIHTGDLDPYRKGLETFACNEEKPCNNFRNAATCEIYARTSGSGDDGRAIAGNFTNDYPGGQGASTASGLIPLSYVQPNPYAPTYIDGIVNDWNNNTPNPLALNFRIYWDGDLLSETINGPGASEGYLFVDKWGGRIFDTGHGNYETTNINGTKKNPCATGDILGDWREEIVMRSSDNKYLRVYTTVTPTEHRMPSLWYDPEYRQAMVWQTEGYNQPPHPSFFVGELEGLTQAPPPLTWTGRSADYNGELRGSLIGGKDVLIMTYGEGQERSIKVNANACPSTLFINSRTTIEGGDQVAYKETKHTWDRVRFTGEPFTGTTNICKQGASATHFVYGNHTHSGKTDVWDGALICNGSVLYSPIWANIHTELFLGNSLDAQESVYKSIEMEYGSALYITNQAISTPLTTDNGYAHMSVGDLSIKEGSRIVFDINGANNANGDRLDITGNVDIRKRNWKYGPQYSAPVFEIRSGGKLAAGEYELGSFGALSSGSLGDIVVETPSGKSGSVAQIYANAGKYYLHIGDSKVADNSGDPLNIGGKIFYVYNELQDKFLSRNGDNAQVDNFGVPMVFQSSGSTYSLMQADNKKFYSGMYWTSANSDEGNATKYRIKPVVGQENTYTFSNTTNPADDGNMYINTTELYRVANNSSAVNTPDLRNSYWKLVTASERNAIIANRTQQNALHAAEQAGITAENYSKLAELNVEENCTNAIPNTTFGLTAENNVYEVFQGTVNLTQTATGLKKGLYRVTLPALYRQGTYTDCASLADNRMSIAYMEVGGSQIQIKDWASAYTNTSNPNSRAEANVKFNEGKYVNEAYAYVANDNGTLSIKLGCPINISAGWFAFGAIKLERLSTTGETPEEPEPTFRLEDGEYYVYNVEADAYLSNGGHWGTQAVLASEGILYKISYNESTKKYTLKSGIKGADKALRPSDGFNDQSGEWEIKETNDGLVLFNGTKYYSSVEDANTPQFLDAATSGSIWKFVSPSERKNNLDNADSTNPVDATVFIKAPDFLNGDVANDAWIGGTKVGGNVSQNCELSNSTNNEKWNAGSYNVYQTITDIPNGVYTLTMQGFYRHGKATSADAYNSNTEVPAELYANDKSVAIKSVYSEALSAQGTGDNAGWRVAFGEYYIPDSQGDAAACFSAGAYVNTIEKIVVTDNKLTIGVRRNGDAIEDWTVFDTFRLTYYGEYVEEQPVEPEPFEPVIANGDYYIMNAESGLFLNGANAWGTKASATTYGQLLTLKMNEDGTYTIDTHISNGGNNHYLGIGDNTFMDQPAANHTIEMVSDGIFTIKNDGKLLAVNEGNIVNFNGTEANDASLWKIVSKSEVLAANASAASAENPVDMTFLIADPNFSRNNTEFNKWEGNKPNKGDVKNATYAQNMNAEMWGGNSQLFDSYQTLTDLPNGIYKLSAQGFYRYNNTTENTNDVAAAAHAAETEKINSFLYANTAETPLMSIADEEAVAANGGKMPFSQLEAKNAFELGLYNNEVEVEVTDGTLRIGVKKTLHEGTDWTIWDNMKLTYLGEKPEEPLFAKGDVNHDGSVNIADVNALVSIILGKSTDTHNAADINDDKSIDISDVTSLIILVSVK